jgi:hypothetical protein
LRVAMRGALSIVGLLAVIAGLVLGVARTLRTDGDIAIDDLASAQVAAVTHIVGKYFQSSLTIEVTEQGHKVMDTVVEQLRYRFPGVAVTTSSRVRVENGLRIERLDQQTDAGKHFDTQLNSTPLYRLWVIGVSSWNCHYSVTLANLFGDWRVVTDSGGCIQSTPVEPI